MNTQIFSVHDQPLAPEDLDFCRAAFQEICATQNIDPASDKAGDTGALIIELYRQGIRDSVQLAAMIRKAGQP
ncbi:hypothetical protein [Rhizobium herbae]|uniref:Uncharacterized protein n=1 Tax=Rhizobium herbae TaxID=508661 RepID=A0ABS4EVV7_9HYPH|nr:hypothetical protein [Rhizobium herbae]MBP1862074.1 hypothetical protein [Rhizobium herbae]